MKYTSYIKTLLVAALLHISGAAFSQNTRLYNTVERSVTSAQAQAQQIQEATVVVTSTFQKPVKMSDVMVRRPRCKDQVLSYKTKTVTCRGTLAASGQRVYTTANCARQDDYTLSTVSLKFSNGRVAKGGRGAVAVSGDVAYVSVKADVTRGLRGLNFASIPAGKSLLDTFGEDIENFLLSFFHSKGVPSHRRSRIGGFSHHPTVKVGEPVLYQGKVIALVKQIPFTFRRGIFGGISESPFAIIHF